MASDPFVPAVAAGQLFCFLSFKAHSLFNRWLALVSGVLIPVIGLIQIGSHAMADRYTYLPLTGLFIIIAWGAPDLLKNFQYRRTLLCLSAWVVLMVLAITSWIQVQTWSNNMSLFQHTLEVTGENQRAHHGLGMAFHARVIVSIPSFTSGRPCGSRRMKEPIMILDSSIWPPDNTAMLRRSSRRHSALIRRAQGPIISWRRLSLPGEIRGGGQAVSGSPAP